jgi:hypothetical protein
MCIIERPFPDKFAVVSTNTYVFDYRPIDDGCSNRIVGRKRLCNGMDVLITNMGMIAFDFSESQWGKFRRIEFRGNGSVPDNVMNNEDELKSLLVNRMQNAIFVIACIYGSYAARRHVSIVDPLLPNLSDVYGWAETPDNHLGLYKNETVRLHSVLSHRDVSVRHLASHSISLDDVNAGLELADRLLVDQCSYVSADPVALVVMTYHAMVLHSQQHAGASIALSAVVVEAALREILCMCGSVEGYKTPRTLRNGGAVIVDKVSKRFFDRQCKLKEACERLERSGVLTGYLSSQINVLRNARNDLMHECKGAAPSASGIALTVVRDVLQICTNESDFELNTSWAYRC